MPESAEAPDEQKARKKAMDFLARREYGRAELVGRLRAAGFDSDIAELAVSGLGEDGLQDDLRFATSFVRSKARRGSGPLRIRQALREKGLAAGVINAAFDADDTDWYQSARDVRLRKFGASPPEDFKARAKQMRFLQYRGFDHDQIRSAFDD